MKILYKKGELALGNHDAKDYSVFNDVIVQEGKTSGECKQTNMRYYPTMEGAVLKMAESVACSEAKSLRGYVRSMRETTSELVSALRGELTA